MSPNRTGLMDFAPLVCFGVGAGGGWQTVTLGMGKVLPKGWASGTVYSRPGFLLQDGGCV